MTKQHDDNEKLTQEANNLAAFEAKAARLSSIPSTEDIRRAQEAQMNETQRALLSYILPVVEDEPEVVVTKEDETPLPNKLPARTVRVPRYGEPK